METLPGICILCSKPQTIVASRLLQCGHLFHETCVDNWFKKRNGCPICRSSDKTKIQIFRPASFTSDKKTKIETTTEIMKPFFAYKSYEELNADIMEKIQSLWKIDEISQMTPARVINTAGKSHLMCKKVIKQKKLFDAYYFALRTGYLLKSIETCPDFMMYFRNHEYEFRELHEENFRISATFSQHLLPVFKNRTFTKEETDDILNLFKDALSSNGKEHSSSFNTSLPSFINL